MRVVIKPGPAVGKITAPPSKSMAHRLLISAALSEGVSIVRGVSSCEDVAATLDCMKAMGVKYEKNGEDVRVFGRPAGEFAPSSVLYCRESGSTLRFLIPWALACGKTVMFGGAESLFKRPMSVYEKLCREKGLFFIQDGSSITVKGPLESGIFNIPGNISSQFISGLIFALPTLKGDSKIKIAPPIESRSYIELTLDAVRSFGIRAEWDDEYTITVPGGQKYKASDVTVEGDYSGAAFIEALNLFGGKTRVEGLKDNSLQGDRVYKKYYALLKSGVPTVHIGDCPDLGPVLFSVAAGKFGGVFTGTKRLKIKESDRAAAMAEELRKFGCLTTVTEDKVVIYPAAFHKPSEPLFGHNDHRIVMALSVLLTATGGEIIGAEAVSKSYPDFFKDLRALGIEVEEYEA